MSGAVDPVYGVLSKVLLPGCVGNSGGRDDFPRLSQPCHVSISFYRKAAVLSHCIRMLH